MPQRLLGCLLVVLLTGSARVAHTESKKDKERRAADAAEEAARKAEVWAKVNAFAACLKRANLDGHYVVRADDVPASPIAGSSGTDKFAQEELVVAASGAEAYRFGLGTFQKGELVRVFSPPPPSESKAETFLWESRRGGLGRLTTMTLQVSVASAYRHNVTRGQGSFQHESPEILSLAIVPEDLDVPCDAVTAVAGKYFEKVDAATVANWEKNHPEIVSGVIVQSVREGMSPAEVEAMFGAPERRAEMAGKMIYFYPKIKVTFTAGKVTGIE